MRDSFGKRNREDPQSPETEEVEENSLDRRVDPEKANVPFQNNFDKRQINRAFQRDKGDGDDERNPISIGLEDIDKAIEYQFQNNFNFHVSQNDGSVQVPIIYDSRERWEWARRNQDLRTVHDKVIFPLITFERTSVSRDSDRENANTLTQRVLNRNGASEGVYLASTRYSKRNRYDNFVALNNRTPQRNFYIVSSPNYVEVSYDFTVFTEYMYQLNSITEEISYLSNEYWGNPDKNLFKVFIDNLDLDVQIENEVRYATATFSANVKGYLLPEDVADVATNKKVYSISEVQFEETTIQGDEIDNI